MKEQLLTTLLISMAALIIIQFYFLFKLYLKTERQRIETTKIVRRIAYLERAKKNKK